MMNLGLTSLLALSCLSVVLVSPPGEGRATQRAHAENKGRSARRDADPSKATAQATPAPSVTDDYVIGPEDVLAINVWREPEVSRVVPVRPDGKISLPLVGDVQASGRTPMELRSELAEKLKAKILNPEVSVIVQEVKSQKFNIVGEVLRPGSYPLAEKITILDALAEAGGFQQFAKVRKIYVLRRLADGSQVRLPFDYKWVIKGRNSAQNVEVKPGDTIVVP
jgi:polysaccharide biosynthesis/export protein